MTDNTQPDAREFTMSQYASKDCMIGAMRMRIADLEAQLASIGAGGVSPLIGQPQAMPDLSQLTERGAVAWAGVDAQGLREGFTAADMATAAAQGFRDGAASTAPPAAQAGGWLPIEGAPKDKSNIVLLRQPCGSIANGFWLAEAYAGNGAWVWPYVHKTPTHWMPLPPPPTSAEGVEHAD